MALSRRAVGMTMAVPLHNTCVFSTLVGNVTDMSPRVVPTPTMSAKNGRRHNVADVVTGFKAESRVGLVIYLAFFT